jgi:heme-degrading monooxygenase HmoA
MIDVDVFKQFDERAPGFLGLEVMSPKDAPAEIWLATRWADEQAFRDWHHGRDFHASSTSSQPDRGQP